jgi:hypothetical protein
MRMVLQWAAHTIKTQSKFLGTSCGLGSKEADIALPQYGQELGLGDADVGKGELARM